MSTWWLGQPIVVGGTNQRDFVHARCSGHVDRRLRGAGWQTAREVEIVQGRSHGWIDVLAYDHRAGRLLVIEVKTRLDDLGAVERQLGWYERSAFDVARRIGLAAATRRRLAPRCLRAPRSKRSCAPIASSCRGRFRSGPRRWQGSSPTIQLRSGRGLALIDPASKRRSLADRRSRSMDGGQRHATRATRMPPGSWKS